MRALSATDLWTAIAVGYAVTGAIAGGFAGFVADEKGRSGLWWFFLGFFCGIFALIAIAGTPAVAGIPGDRDSERRTLVSQRELERAEEEARYEDEARRRAMLPPR